MLKLKSVYHFMRVNIMERFRTRECIGKNKSIAGGRTGEPVRVINSPRAESVGAGHERGSEIKFAVKGNKKNTNERRRHELTT